MHIRLSLLLLLAVSSLQAQPCPPTRPQEVRDLLAALDASAAVGAVWSDYTVANHPVVLLSQSSDLTARACATIWRHRKPPQEVVLSSGMRLSTPLYAMWNGDSVGRNPNKFNAGIVTTFRAVPPELETALRRDGDTRVVIVPSPLRLEDLGNFGRALQSMNVRVVPMLTQLAIHESYHLHVQMPTWLDQTRRYEWPTWDMQPDRKALVERCYAPAGGAVNDALKKEIAALDRAWHLLMGTRDSATDAQALGAAREFIAARRERYGLLKDVTVPVTPEVSISCERADDVLELQEGSAQWIGFVTTVRAGVANAQVGRSNEAFYTTGPYQLWILERLIGADSMRALTRDIAQSTEPSGPTGAVFGRFVAIVESR
ncbi:MAG: hypothetical protein AB1762_12340 [Gemmatimonadota bacterium]